MHEESTAIPPEKFPTPRPFGHSNPHGLTLAIPEEIDPANVARRKKALLENGAFSNPDDSGASLQAEQLALSAEEMQVGLAARAAAREAAQKQPIAAAAASVPEELV